MGKHEDASRPRNGCGGAQKVLTHLAVLALCAAKLCCIYKYVRLSAQACFENLAHEHLVVSTATAALLVDPDFRDQFLITAPSTRYAAALACVPDEFVGGASRLTALVEFLSGEHRGVDP